MERPEPISLEEISAHLDGGHRGLRFGSNIEERFQAERRDARVRHFFRMTLSGTLLKDIFAVPEVMIVPDQVRLVLISHAILTLLGILMAFLIRRRVVPPEAVAVNVGLISLSVLMLMRCSESPQAEYLLFMTPLLFVFGNTVFPFSFRVALPFSILCVVSSAVAVIMQPGTETAVRVLMLTVEVALAVYTLMATHRSEAFERRSYLLTLRETLRGASLVEANRELRDLSDTDQLTGVANRRVFDRTLEQFWKEHLQTHTPLALLMIDIDHFKRLNDTHGHANGDVCLKKLATRLQHLMRPHQVLARYGGEEFVVLLEGEGAYQARAVAERLRLEIEAMPVRLVTVGELEIRVSISVGYAAMIPRHGSVAADLFSRADQALYAAKKNGRNRVEGHLEAVPQETEGYGEVASPRAAAVGSGGN